MRFKLFLVLIIGLFLFSPVMARDYETIDDFFDDVPSLNEELQSSEVIIPKPANLFINNGNVLIEIMMDEGEIKEFYFSIENKKVANILIGKPEKFKYIISTNENIANEIIISEDKIQTIFLHYKNKEINVKAIRLQDKIKFSFVKIFLKSL
ncbi:MAG: hypothetical protein QT10_C0013G0010 [archaeon GW2011_AR19]|nr:MAG: hypothetical protein QT10_C0013G0010 [archaeon GW2011_AR19]